MLKCDKSEVLSVLECSVHICANEQSPNSIPCFRRDRQAQKDYHYLFQVLRYSLTQMVHKSSEHRTRGKWRIGTEEKRTIRRVAHATPRLNELAVEMLLSGSASERRAHCSTRTGGKCWCQAQVSQPVCDTISQKTYQLNCKYVIAPRLMFSPLRRPEEFSYVT